MLWIFGAFLLSFLSSLLFTSGPPANASGNSSHIATNSPLHILSAIFCGTGGVDDANTTGRSSLVPPRSVTATDSIGFWFVATIDVLDSNPAPVPCTRVSEGTVRGWVGWVISGTDLMADAGGIPPGLPLPVELDGIVVTLSPRPTI